jgi:hypothetical protein
MVAQSIHAAIVNGTIAQQAIRRLLGVSPMM